VSHDARIGVGERFGAELGAVVEREVRSDDVDAPQS
jgi:hypothetical protein